MMNINDERRLEDEKRFAEERKFEIPRNDTFDDVYQTMVTKYDEYSAKEAIYNFLTTYNYNYITRTNNARENMKNLLFEDIYHVIANYAVSSFIINQRTVNYTYKDLCDYALNANNNFDYSKENARDIFALAVAISPFWTYNIFACNKKLTNKVIESFIDERYGLNKKNELDELNKAKLIRFSDNKKMFFLSKYNLNVACREMKKDVYQNYGRSR